MNFVSLFAGIGGEHIALKRAVAKVCASSRNRFYACDVDPRRAASFAANFPETTFRVRDLAKTTALDEGFEAGGIDFLWASPPCTEFSRVKGTTGLKAGVQNLANDVLNGWIRTARPRAFVVENVSGMQNWGPLDERGARVKSRLGEYFERFLGELRALGYPFRRSSSTGSVSAALQSAFACTSPEFSTQRRRSRLRSRRQRSRRKRFATACAATCRRNRSRTFAAKRRWRDSTPPATLAGRTRFSPTTAFFTKRIRSTARFRR